MFKCTACHTHRNIVCTSNQCLYVKATKHQWRLQKSLAHRKTSLFNRMPEIINRGRHGNWHTATVSRTSVHPSPWSYNSPTTHVWYMFQVPRTVGFGYHMGCDVLFSPWRIAFRVDAISVCESSNARGVAALFTV